MQFVREWLDYLWEYIIYHKWSKDILRGNFLYVFIILIYSCLHLVYHGLNLVPWGIFFRVWLVLNICLFFKALLDYLGGPDD